MQRLIKYGEIMMRAVKRTTIDRPRLRRTWKNAADPSEIAWIPASTQDITGHSAIHDFVADPTENRGVLLHDHAETGGFRSGQAPLTLFRPPPTE